MEDSVFCRVFFGDLNFNFVLGGEYTLADLKNKITHRFGISVFQLSTSFPGHHNSMLDCDMDLNLIIHFARLLKCEYVDIFVSKVGDVSNSNVSNERTDSENALVLGSNISRCSHEVNESEAYGRFFPSNGVSFMTSVWKTYIKHEKQTFTGGVHEFRDKLRKFCIESGFKIEFKRNTFDRVTGICGNECDSGQCTWKVHAIKLVDSDTFEIRKLCNKHTCTGRIRSNRSDMVNSNVVASIIAPKVKLNQNLLPKDIIRDVYLDYGIKIDYHLAWYGREIARAKINGDDVSGYSKLNWYVDQLQITNPKSHCVLDCDDSHFRRIFISYGACIEGFQYCRPLLFIDATHIKSKFKGVLLCAT